MFFEQRHGETALGQRISGGDTGDTATYNSNIFHYAKLQTSGVRARPHQADRTPPLFWT